VRVILDTNVLVSVVLVRDGPLAAIWRAWRRGRFQVLMCDELTNEVRDVLTRPKLKRLVRGRERDDLLDDLETLSTSVVLEHPYPEFEDDGDRFLLALAAQGRADILVTGDGALQALERIGTTLIAAPADFARALQEL
jgi:uncharacterized protein